jgi:uncharacterized linocin/CFP29 family protein
MDMLKRSIAPISDEAWNEIDDQARRTLHALLSARKIVDVDGPKGWNYAGVPMGRLEIPAAGGQKKKGSIEYGIHRVQPLVETRSYFDLDVWELDNVVRGARDIDFSALEESARAAAQFEETAIYHGFAPSGIRGLEESSPYDPIKIGGGKEDLLESVSRGITQLLASSVEGPYGLVVSPALWQQLSGYVRGYPLRRHLEDLLGGPVVIGPFVDEAYLLSMRGGDTNLIIGQDLSIGYLSHDSRTVHLFFTESFTFQVLDPSVVVCLQTS